GCGRRDITRSGGGDGRHQRVRPGRAPASRGARLVTRTVGILALQGNVREHEAVLTALGSHVVRVRRPTELDEIDGLVIPGGESSTIDKLARAFGVREPLIEKIRAGFPVFGTCAGLILLADRIVDG